MKATVSPALSKVTKPKQAAAKKTKPAAKVKKSVGAGKGKKTVISAKKTSPAAKKSVRFEKDDDFVPVDKESDEEEDVAADDEGGDDSDFDTDVSKVTFASLYTIPFS